MKIMFILLQELLHKLGLNTDSIYHCIIPRYNLLGKTFALSKDVLVVKQNIPNYSSTQELFFIKDYFMHQRMR